MPTSSLRISSVAIAVLLSGTSLLAIFSRPEQTPVKRLLSNALEKFNTKTKSADDYYYLGRLYSIAFAQQAQVYYRVDKEGKETLAFDSPSGPNRDLTKPLKPADIKNANEALVNYRKAIELKPADGKFHFSLGWMLDQVSHYPSSFGTSKNALLDQAIPEWRTAYQLALKDDLNVKGRFGPLTSELAAESLIAALRERYGKDKAATQEITEISANLDTLRKKPMMVTPIVFTLRPDEQLNELISARQVTFDVGGLGDGRSWPWLQPETCLLVWDPENTGVITSGRQLFGSFTWQIFWQNGFEPLAALDNNRDGVLTGGELKGIAVWQDRNSNGISDPGEVMPVEAFGITKIAVSPDPGTLQNNGGIYLRDGRRITTFDWTPTGQ